jgi:hypothetical protein
MSTIYHAPPTKPVVPNRQSHGTLPVLGSGHIALLLALLRLHYLTSDAACRLLYSYPGSLPFVRGLFRHLESLTLVVRLYLGRQSPGGSSKKVFTLSGKGLALLRGEGYEVWPRYHAGEQANAGIWHLHHHLATTAFLVAAERLVRDVPGLSLERELVERALRNRYRVRVTIVDGSDGKTRQRSVYPDAFVEFRRGKVLLPVAVELDRGTEVVRAFRAKLAGLIAFAQGPYAEVYKRRTLTIAILTTESERRATALTRWTEAELNRTGLGESLASLFAIAHADLNAIEPSTLYLSPLWRRPFDPTPRALLADLQELRP